MPQAGTRETGNIPVARVSRRTLSPCCLRALPVSLSPQVLSLLQTWGEVGVNLARAQGTKAFLCTSLWFSAGLGRSLRCWDFFFDRGSHGAQAGPALRILLPPLLNAGVARV